MIAARYVRANARFPFKYVLYSLCVVRSGLCLYSDVDYISTTFASGAYCSKSKEGKIFLVFPGKSPKINIDFSFENNFEYRRVNFSARSTHSHRAGSGHSTVFRDSGYVRWHLLSEPIPRQNAPTPSRAIAGSSGEEHFVAF